MGRLEQGIQWVKLELYEKLTGDTAEAVRNRRKKGIWKDGLHSKVVNGRIWVNLIEAQEWVKQSRF